MYTFIPLATIIHGIKVQELSLLVPLIHVFHHQSSINDCSKINWFFSLGLTLAPTT